MFLSALPNSCLTKLKRLSKGRKMDSTAETSDPPNEFVPIDNDERHLRQKKAFWIEEIGDRLKPEMREMLESYSGIPPDEVEPHLRRVRERTFQKSPWPCVAMWSFLHQHASEHPYYASILRRAKDAEAGEFRVCDVGCGVGQDLRVFASHGVPGASLAATDLNANMWECGFDMFRDRDKEAPGLKGVEFVAGDFLALGRGAESAVNKLKGTVDVAMAGHFLHVFGWEEQVAACKGLVSLLKDKGRKAGTCVIGWSLGGPGEQGTMPVSGRKVFLHSADTFKDMWKVVGQQTGSEWEVEVWARPFDAGPKLDRALPKNKTYLVFGVTRKA